MTNFGPTTIYREFVARLLLSGLLIVAAIWLPVALKLSPKELAIADTVLFFGAVGAFKYYYRARRCDTSRALTVPVRTTLAFHKPPAVLPIDETIEFTTLMSSQPRIVSELRGVWNSPSSRLVTILLRTVTPHEPETSREVLNSFALRWEAFVINQHTQLYLLRAAALHVNTCRQVFIFDDDEVVGALLEETLEDLGLPARRLPMPPYMRDAAEEHSRHLHDLPTFLSVYRSGSREPTLVPLVSIERQLTFVSELVEPLSQDFARTLAAFLGAIARIGLWRRGKKDVQEILQGLPAA